MQVCNLSTPAQYFHALRRQSVREVVKPLVIMTPKSLLNLPQCTSSIEDMAEGTHFQTIIDEATEVKNPEKTSRLIFCSGKVYYDLIKYRDEAEIDSVAIIRVEQFYPWDRSRIKEVVAQYGNATKWVWCQEEPLNMGGWTFIGPRLQKLTEHKVRYAGRSGAASPATGAKAIHKREQRKLVEKAFSV